MLCFLIFLVFLFFLIFYVAKNFNSNIPPGPTGIPFLGYIPFLGILPHIKFLEKLRPKYGNVFSFYFGSKLAIVLNDWTSVKEAYVNQGKIFSGRTGLYLFQLLNQGHGLINAEGIYWKNQRKFLSLALKEILTNNSMDHIIKEEAKYLYELIAKNMKTNLHGMDFHILFQGCFVNLIATIVFGHRFEYDDPDILILLNLVHENFKLVGSKAAPLNFLPQWVNDISAIKKIFGLNELHVNINLMTKFVLKQIQIHLDLNDSQIDCNYQRKTLLSKNLVKSYLKKIMTSDITSCYINNNGDSNKDADISYIEKSIILSDKINGYGENEDLDKLEPNKEFKCPYGNYNNLAHNETNLRDFLCLGSQKDGFTGFDMLMSIMDVFLGGTETTQTVMRWAILFMTKYQLVQERVYTEIKEFINGHKKHLDPGTLPHIFYDDRQHLPYTTATILEIQRRASIAPLGFFHSTSEDANLFDYFIPQDSIIIANHWAIHHDPNYWEDPYKFDPQRFLDENNNVIHDKPSYIPYSLGPRYCFGANLAKNELFTIFANLILRFHFRFPEPTNMAAAIDDGYHDYSVDGDQLSGTLALTWAPLPYKVVAEPRPIPF